MRALRSNSAQLANGRAFGALAAAIRSLFANNEQGVWCDPSDFSTMFQDAAGTTPVTAVGQPVGLVLDKRLGLVRVDIPTAAMNTGFSSVDARWTYATSSVSWAGGGGANNTTTKSAYLGSSYFGKFVELSFTITGYSGTDTCGIDNGVLSRLPNDTGASGAIDTRVTANGTYTFRGYWRGAGAADGRTLTLLGRGTNSFTVSNISVRELPGNHATQATATSRPTLQQDSGGRYYLLFDGVDDWLQTGSIDFTSTDKMTVVAGVRKLSDAAAGMVAEFTTTSVNDGSFYLAAPITNGSTTFGFATRGTVQGVPLAPSGYAAPVSAVVSARFDNSGSGTGDTAQVRPRVNGVSWAGVSGTSAGGYANAALYIGRRAGTSLPFNGRLYSLIVRGAQSSQSQIEASERYVNQKTGAY